MPIRDIIEIDEEKCNGCGQCIPNCAEGALQIIEGKARLIKDKYCDGLGACLGYCPQDALRLVKREAPDFDEEAVEKYMATRQPGKASYIESSDPDVIMSRSSRLSEEERSKGTPPSRRQWPLAVRLVPVKALFFQNADLLVTADCVPFTLTNFYEGFLKNRVMVFGCPKFDDEQGFLEKLTAILRSNTIRSITLVNMEVPCCFGLQHIAETAIANSGKSLPIQQVIVTTQGETRQESATLKT